MLNLLLLQAVPVAPIDTWLTALPSLGVGGILAGIMFFFYRADRKDSEEKLSKYTESFVTIVQENTKAMSHLADAIDRLR